MHSVHSSRPFSAILSAPFAALGVQLHEGKVMRLEFLPLDTPAKASPDVLVARLAAQLAAYCSDPGYRFDLPIEAHGSDFRRRVWQALLGIPAGHTTTYGELARQLGSSARAVGQALGDNPLPIVIPCHRVVAAHGLGGFNHHGGGFSLDVKRWLLRHEGAL